MKLGAEAGSKHIFEVHVTDLAGQETVQKLTFQIPAAPITITYNDDANLWTNTATFTVANVPSNATNVKVQYRIKTQRIGKMLRTVEMAFGRLNLYGLREQPMHRAR